MQIYTESINKLLQMLKSCFSGSTSERDFR